MAMTEEDKKFWYQRFTLRGRILHPNLLEPKMKDKGRMVFETMFCWKAEENQAEMGKLMAFMQQAKQKYHPNIPDMYFSNPLKHFDTYMKRNGQPNPEYLRGHYWLNASTGLDMPPAIVNAQMQPIMDKAEVYSGRNAVINITFWNNTGGKDGTGQKGVSCNINAVMLQAGGEEVKGAAAINVNEVFGSFAQDMGTAPQYGQDYRQPAANPALGAPYGQPQAPQYPAQPAYAPQAPAYPQAPAAPQNPYAPQAPAQPAYNPYAPQAPAAPQQPYQPNGQPAWNPNGNNNGSY